MAKKEEKVEFDLTKELEDYPLPDLQKLNSCVIVLKSF